MRIDPILIKTQLPATFVQTQNKTHFYGNQNYRSGILPVSRYENDWLSHRLFHNLKSHSNALNYKTKPFAEVHGSLMSRIERNDKFYNFSLICQEKSRP